MFNNLDRLFRILILQIGKFPNLSDIVKMGQIFLYMPNTYIIKIHSQIHTQIHKNIYIPHIDKSYASKDSYKLNHNAQQSTAYVM